MRDKIVSMPEWMFKQMQSISQHSGQSQNAIVRLALNDYMKKYEQENQLTINS